MKKISMFLTLVLLVSCVGSLVYFDNKDRYSMKIAMVKIKKNYDYTARTLDKMDGKNANIYKYLNNINFQFDSLNSIEVSRNQLIFDEKINDAKDIVNSIKEAVKDDKKDRARYHFKRLRNNCISCHTRFRIGVNF